MTQGGILIQFWLRQEEQKTNLGDRDSFFNPIENWLNFSHSFRSVIDHSFQFWIILRNDLFFASIIQRDQLIN